MLTAKLHHLADISKTMLNYIHIMPADHDDTSATVAEHCHNVMKHQEQRWTRAVREKTDTRITMVKAFT